MISRRQLVLGSLAGIASAGLAACSRSTGGVTPANGRPRKEFGIASDPWKTADWATAVGARPTMSMEFESWDKNRDISTHFQAAVDAGMKSYMLTWEPWAPVDASLGPVAQEKAQPKYSNAAIAGGALDAYIKMFATSIRKSSLTTFYLRFAHEMNGNWYPWSNDPAGYINSWRHVVNVFRAEGVHNVRYVWSPTPSMFQNDTAWTQGADKYWPGPEYVDYVGATVLNLGGQKETSVAMFATRLRLMHQHYGKDVMLCELNTDYDGRVKWLSDLRTWLSTPDGDWVKGLVLEQNASRAQLQLTQLGQSVGNMDWRVTADPSTLPIIRGLISDIT